MERFVSVKLYSGAVNYFRPSAVTKFAVGTGGTLAVHFLDGQHWSYEGEDAKRMLAVLDEQLVKESNP